MDTLPRAGSEQARAPSTARGRSAPPGGHPLLGEQKWTAAKPLPTLWGVLNSIGVGLYQVQAQLVGGGMNLADGAEIQTIATVALPMAAEMGLTPEERGHLASMIYVGVLAGNLASGYVGDVLGRRAPIIVGYGMLALLGAASALAQSYSQLLVLRTVFGVFYGIGAPCWNAMAAEITPSAWRMVIAGTSQVYFQLGELFSILVTWWNDPTMQTVDWRWQLVMSAVPAAVCFVLALFLLDESPAFLAVRGEHERARAVLERVRRWNGQPHVAVDFRPPQRQPHHGTTKTFRSNLATLFSLPYLFTTLTVIYSFVVVNFIFYGNLYAIPQILPGLSSGDESQAPTVSMALGVVTGEVPGVLLGATLGSLLPRRMACGLFMSIMGAASLTFGRNVGQPSPSDSQRALLLVSFWGLRFASNFGFVVLWQYSAEVYPTVMRNTGCAVAFGAGRLGAILAPAIFERALAATGQHQLYFAICGALCLANIPLLATVGETRGKDLADTLGADVECEPLVVH